MTKTLYGLLLAAALIGGPVTTAAERAANPPALEHRAALNAFRATMVRAYLQGDPRSILAHFSDSVRLMPGYQKTILGKPDATTYHQAFLKRFTVTAYERQPIESVDLGQRVMEIGRFTMVANVAGETHVLAGKYMDLWEKTSAGKLALHTAGWNYDQLPKIAEQLRFQEVPSVHMALQARVPVSAGISFELAALNEFQESAILQHDGKTWTLFYADDAIALSNQGAVVSGRQALDDYLIGHAKALPVFEKLDLRTDKIDDLGEYVVEYASAVVAWKADAYSGVSLGKGILVWRRAENGALRIWRAISMYD